MGVVYTVDIEDVLKSPPVAGDRRRDKWAWSSTCQSTAGRRSCVFYCRPITSRGGAALSFNTEFDERAIASIMSKRGLTVGCRIRTYDISQTLTVVAITPRKLVKIVSRRIFKSDSRTLNRGTVNRGTINRGQLIAGQLIAWTNNRSDN